MSDVSKRRPGPLLGGATVADPRPALAPTAVDRSVSTGVMVGMYEYVSWRRKNPSDDSITVLADIPAAIPSETRWSSPPEAKVSTHTNSPAERAHTTAPVVARASASSACDIVADAR